MKKCPCEECILIPVCRNRLLPVTADKCELLDNYLEVNSIKYKHGGMRLIEVKALDEINKVFKWGIYDYSM